MKKKLKKKETELSNVLETIPKMIEGSNSLLEYFNYHKYLPEDGSEISAKEIDWAKDI